jgi:hypothetical protein
MRKSISATAEVIEASRECCGSKSCRKGETPFTHGRFKNVSRFLDQKFLRRDGHMH